MHHLKKIYIKNQSLCHIFIFTACILFTLYSPLSKAKTIVVSLPVLAGMIQPLLNSTDRIITLLDTNQSPHDLQLKPSKILMLHQADLVLGIGTQIDSWLNKALHRNSKVSAIFMVNLVNIKHLPVRKQHTRNQEIDPHLWTSSHNATIFIHAVAKKLGTDSKRLQHWIKQIKKTTQDITHILEHVKTKPFIVLHDSFQYFESDYSLNNVGIVKTDHSLSVSLKHEFNLRKLVKNKQVKCFIKEPQFSGKYLHKLVEISKGTAVSINPIGRELTPYNMFLLGIAYKYQKCLS